MEYGATVSSAPRLAPSSLNCTPATPVLSKAVAETLMLPETVELAMGAVRETVGGVVSEELTVTVTPALGSSMLPMSSTARLLIVMVPAVLGVQL
jgi:hypothetical protein